MKKEDIKNLKKEDVGEKKISVSGEIDEGVLNKAFSKALLDIQKTFESDGFRKGFVPESIILSKLGDMKILEVAAEDLLGEAYGVIIDDLKIDAIGRPEISINKIAKGSPLGFSMAFYLRPEVKLADYKSVAKKENEKPQESSTVSDDEVDSVIKELRYQIAHSKIHSEGHFSEDDHSHPEIKDEDLPEVNMDFVKMFGPFKNLEEFKEKIKGNIKEDKDFKIKDKRRTNLLEAILKESDIKMPEIIVLGEIDKIKAQFEEDLKKTGLSFDGYLSHIKKTEQEVVQSWKPLAKTRAETQLLLSEIAKIEKIEPKEEDVKREVDNIVSSVKGADRFRARMYVENFLTNDLVIKFLESIKTDSKPQ